MSAEPPVAGSYWVVPGRLAAGPYPDGAGALADAGVDLVVDLTEADEGLAPYAPQLDGVEHLRRAIPDFGCCTPVEMRETLDALDAALAAGRRVYVHCLGGRGRTGTVVACWLVRHGHGAEEALALVREGRGQRSPETEEQRRFVRSWRAGR